MPLKYVICPGFITSKSDGQRHYIGPMQLANLYGLAPHEYVVYEPAPWWTRSVFKAEIAKCEGLIKLRPNYDGNYNLPPAPQENDEPTYINDVQAAAGGLIQTPIE